MGLHDVQLWHSSLLRFLFGNPKKHIWSLGNVNACSATFGISLCQTSCCRWHAHFAVAGVDETLHPASAYLGWQAQRERPAALVNSWTHIKTSARNGFFMAGVVAEIEPKVPRVSSVHLILFRLILILIFWIWAPQGFGRSVSLWPKHGHVLRDNNIFCCEIWTNAPWAASMYRWLLGLSAVPTNKGIFYFFTFGTAKSSDRCI